jgi:phosphatidylserine/phosphatidylglycerophosphate/cardiolipin synthase-like enzyme
MKTMPRTRLRFAPLALLLAACASSSVQTVGGPSPDEDAGTPAFEDSGATTDDGAPPAPPGTDAAVPQALRVVVKPNGQADAEIVGAIRSATRTIRLYIYLLTDDDVMSALIARARAGVDVRVVLNKTFPDGSSDMQTTFDRLAAGRVKVVWAPAAFTYMHAKTLVVDDRIAWIMTMNLTAAGSTGNREYLLEDQEPTHVATAAALFDADYANRSYTPSSSLLVAPVNARQQLAELVVNAARSVDVEGETLSDARLTTALVDAKRRGVAVRIVLSRDSTPTPARVDAVAALKAVGVPVVAFGAASGSGSASTPYMHAKAILVDGVRAYVGSANFTANSLDSNREIGVLVRDPASVSTLARTIDADFRAGSRL